MPTLTKDGASASTYAPTIITIPLEYHLLRAISVHDVSGTTIGNDIRIQAGILMGNPQQNTKVALLLGGIIGPDQGLGMACSIPTEPGMQAYCEVTGPTTAIVRLSIVLWKIRIDDKGEFQLDP